MINSAVIMGRITADPELKTTQSGTSVCSFTVAVDRNYQKQGQDHQADFISVVTWRQTAEFVAKWFRKGQMIAVQGEIQTRNYEDRKGNKRTAVEVVASQVSFCGSKNEEGSKGRPAEYPPEPAPEEPNLDIEAGDDDELPF